MTPAKKATPSLKDVLKDSKEEPVVTRPDPEVDENHPVEPVESVVGSPAPAVDGPVEIPATSDPVHAWEENLDQGTATVHPDVVVTAPLHTAATQHVGYTTDYANPADVDDKGLLGEVDESEPKDDVVEE